MRSFRNNTLQLYLQRDMNASLNCSLCMIDQVSTLSEQLTDLKEQMTEQRKLKQRVGLLNTTSILPTNTPHHTSLSNLMEHSHNQVSHPFAYCFHKSFVHLRYISNIHAMMQMGVGDIDMN